MSTPLVVGVGVGFSYGRRAAVRSLDLSVGPGCIVALVGLNGAGKSTALALLAGVLAPREGEVRICGGRPTDPKIRRNLFLLGEQGAVAPHLLAHEVVRFHLDLYGCEGPRKERVASCLDRLGLTPVARKRVSTFSKGMRRRLELAALLAVDPLVWLLDEPHSGLDPLGLRLLTELLREARGRGRAVIMATHRLSEVPRLADEVVVLEEGAVRFRGTPADLLQVVDGRHWFQDRAHPEFESRVKAWAQEHSVGFTGPFVAPESLEQYLFHRPEEVPPGGDGV